jgi:hypothetical protein
MIVSMNRRAFLLACSLPTFAQLAALGTNRGSSIVTSTSPIDRLPAVPAIPNPESNPGPPYVELTPAAEWGSRLGFVLDPPVEAWQEVGGNDVGQVVHTGGGYRLELNSYRREPHQLSMQFHLQRDDGRNFTVLHYSVTAQISLVGIYRIWNYRDGRPEFLGEFDVFTRGLSSNDEGGQVSGANTGIPIIALTDRGGCNRFTFDMLDQVEIADLRVNNYSLGSSQRGEGLNFSFEFVKPTGYTITRSTIDDGIWFDAESISWFEAVKRYTRWVETNSNIHVLRAPQRAYAPIRNSWYPFGQNIDEKTIRENALLCRQVGITNLCIDAGYNHLFTI